MEFVSKYKNYRIVLEPKSRILVDGEPVNKPGITVEFNNFVYHTEDDNVIKLLKENRMYNINFYDVSKAKKAVKKVEEEVVSEDAVEPSSEEKTKKTKSKKGF